MLSYLACAENVSTEKWVDLSAINNASTYTSNVTSVRSCMDPDFTRIII